MHEHAQGLGFRGDIFGGYILYNCGFIQSENRFFVNGEAVVDDKIYTLGTVDMYTFGRYFLYWKGSQLIILCLSSLEISLKISYWDCNRITQINYV